MWDWRLHPAPGEAFLRLHRNILLWRTRRCSTVVPPATSTMRPLRLAVEAALRQCRPQRPPAVWVCQLGSPGSGGFQPAGNAFPIDPVPQNIAYLKEAIKQKNPNTVSCDAYQMDIYRRKDGRWVKETMMSSSLRNTDEADCYGFMLPAGAAGAT
ncbi:unnamed protein product [Effrenium voratum]|uniref:Uncharacterized protein n=1 Tax=Effrenium voratum TaxID=2562239 RepID=A0AA36HWD4_9DINO|nr:unnamed protein product [Effrenium voratum]